MALHRSVQRVVSGGGRSRRAVAVLVTVLLSVVAASIALAIARQTVLDARSVTSRRDHGAALRAADSTLAEFEAALRADPDVYLHQVLPFERPRECLAGPLTGEFISPENEWPESCGTIWGYPDEPDEFGLYTPGQTRVEITPPTPYNTTMRVRVLSRFGSLDAGYDVDYLADGANRWVLASTGPLDLTAPQDGTETVAVSGAIYSTGTLTATPGSDVGLTSATLGTDTGFSGLPDGDVSNRWFGPTATPGDPEVRDIRGIQPAPLTAGLLTAELAALHSTACPDSPTPMQIFSTGAYANTSSRLCFQAGGPGHLQAAGPGVVVPATTRSYMVLPDMPAVGQLSVYVSDTELDLSDTSPMLCSPQPDCSLPAHAAADADPLSDTVVEDTWPNFTEDTHPGELAFWEHLGDFYIPISGVVGFDGDVVIGYCSDDAHQYETSDPCAAISGPNPGLTVSTPMTIVAGSVDDPESVVVGTSIHAADTLPGETPAMLALAASDRVVIPYFARPGNQDMTLTAELVGAGLATNPGEPSVAAFPATLPLTGPGDTDAADTVTVVGSVVGRDLRLGLAGARTLELQYRPEARTASAPNFDGSGASWARLKSYRITGDAVCAAQTCPDF